MRKPARYSTARGLIKMSWNKINLYNLAHSRSLPDLSRKTVFQQKWQAKKECRSYHGSDITEKQFLRHWTPRLPPIPEIPTVQQHLQANKADATGARSSYPPITALTFAHLERRADVIVFRSHFASSIYQAKQLVGQGRVKVNGETITQPGYMVKDLDVISVDPEVVCTLKKEEGQSELQFKPKEFQQPFMFLPDYLEVNYNICSTVFLREPMPRKGRVEIPSPYPPERHSLVYEYYVRRK